MAEALKKFSDWNGKSPLFTCPPDGRRAYVVKSGASNIVAYGCYLPQERVIFELEVTSMERERFNAEMARENADIVPGLPPFEGPVADKPPTSPTSPTGT